MSTLNQLNLPLEPVDRATKTMGPEIPTAESTEFGCIRFDASGVPEEWFWRDPTGKKGRRLWHMVNWDCPWLQGHSFHWSRTGTRYVWEVWDGYVMIGEARYVPHDLLDGQDDPDARNGYWREVDSYGEDRYLSLGDCARGMALRRRDDRMPPGRWPLRQWLELEMKAGRRLDASEFLRTMEDNNWLMPDGSAVKRPGIDMPWHLVKVTFRP